MVRVKVCVALLLSFGAAVVWAAPKCNAADKDKPKCVSCSSMGVCQADGTITKAQEDCPPGQACMEGYGVAFCAPADETNCNKCTNGAVICDLYNPQRVVVCTKERAPILTKLCGQGDVCKEGKCVKGSGSTDTYPTCDDVTGTAGVYKVSKPSCRAGVLCYEGKISFTPKPCSQSQYFNPETGTCLNLPVNLCEGKGDGLFPHMTDCTKTVVCQGGTWIMDIPCKAGELVIDGECQTSVDRSSCPPLDGCTFALDGSTTPGSPSKSTTPPQIPDCTASTANKRYPHKTDCKKYNTCRLTSGNVYKMVESTCIGTLVFNPDKLYCDSQANVVGCVVNK